MVGDNRKRLEFFGIDDAATGTLRASLPLLRELLPGVLDEFYATVRATPDIVAMFNGESSIRHARAMQEQHWLRLFSGAFDEAYFTSAAAIGRAHNRVGLEPDLYIGAYAFVLSRLFARAARATSGRGLFAGKARAGELERLLAALSSAVMLDMERAISVYLEEGRAEKHRALESMAGTVEREMTAAVERVTGQSTRMSRSAERMAGSAGMVGERSQSVAAAAHQAGAAAQSVAVAAEELSAAIVAIGQQVEQSRTVTDEAVERSRTAQDTIGELSTAIARIDEIARLITDIASQTNLLALNATIEAARAGEAGKGFAVVANEVKNLATQTARATEEISRQIAQIQAMREASVGAVEGIGATIADMRDIAASIAAAVDQQKAATQDIARNVTQAADLVNEVSTHIDEVAQEALSTGTQADTVRDAAGEVVAGVQALQRVMVRTIRTASPEVDRRRKPRFRVAERCTVTIGAESRTGGVTNLSEGGAIVTGAPAAEPGAFGRLRLERGGAELPFTVVGAGEDRLHVKFVLDDDARTRFLPVFRDITRGLTPLGEEREAAA